MVYGLALDGVGSAAAEALAHAACRRFATLAATEGLQTTVSLSPGMLGWPVEEGQRQLFSLLDASLIGVILTRDYLMIPRKSLSLVIGVGTKVNVEGKPCDFCTMYDTCRYRSHDAAAA
jgi:cobalamin-dependent methionine synthase I